MAVQNAFPIKRPTLLLDFQKSQRVDGRVTFTRASEATRFNRYGQMEVVQNNTPRIDFDPVTGLCRGLLIEEQRTNLLLRSAEFQTTWTNERSSDQSDVAVAPDGTLSADKLVEDTTAANSHLIRQGVSGLASGSTLSLSVYLKPSERSSACLMINDGGSLANAVLADFNLSTGVFSAVQSLGTFTTASATIFPVGNGWFRCSISGVATGVTSVQTRVFLSNGVTTNYTGDGTSGIFLWGAQLEAGSFPTSYIPTSASQATRNADVASITGANFSAFYRQDEGTLYAEFSRSSISSQGRVAGLVQSANDRAHIITATNNTAVYFSRNATGTVVNNIGGTALTIPMRACIGIKDGEHAFVAGGGVVAASSAIGTPRGMSELAIGVLASFSSFDHLNGHIARIAYWNERLPNATLQALTS
jgi:hypothetical protein